MGEFGNFNKFSDFGFHFKDPNEMFKEFFDQGFFNDDEFGFMGNRMGTNGARNTGCMFNIQGLPFHHVSNRHKSMFTQAFEDDFFGDGFNIMSGGFKSDSQPKNYGTSKSVSTITKIVNGRAMTVTTTTTRDANGNVTKEVREETDDGRGNRRVRFLTGKDEENGIDRKFIKGFK